MVVFNTTQTMKGIDMTLLRDKDVANLLGLSPSWVRVQRWKRRDGQDHTLTVDPVLIGTSPRYKTTDIEEWITTLENGGNDD